MEIKSDDYCFVCGPANPVGLRLVFEIDKAAKTATTVFTPRREHQGYDGITHGGIISCVLDEAMIKLCWSLGIPAVTARIEIRLTRPVPPGETLSVKGWLKEDRGRVVETAAAATNSSGEAVANATATAVVRGPRLQVLSSLMP